MPDPLTSAMLGAPHPSGAPRWQFRDFKLDAGARTLSYQDKDVPIGSRAFDLLVVLLAAQGKLVSASDIIARVWPSTRVEPGNLRFQMAALRKTLGPDRDVIKTISGRGYLLVAGPGRLQPTGRQPDRARIAIIDDDSGTREALTGLLRSAGMHPVPYASASAFLNDRSADEPACLILDVWMPEQSGLDFQAELMRRGRCPPIIFISGHADVPMSVKAMKAGAAEFFTKPVRHQDLLNAVQETLVASSPESIGRGGASGL